MTIGKQGEPIAFEPPHSEDNLFDAIVKDDRSRIKTDQLNYEALMPDGPFGLWREGETVRRLSVLVESFSDRPELPKMMDTRPILRTFAAGCEEGHLVLRLARPDRSFRTWWKTEVTDELLREPAMEVVLPEAAELDEIAPELLEPDALKELWTSETITLADLRKFFDGSGRLVFELGGYSQKVAVPKASADVVAKAVRAAVKAGSLWATTESAGFWKDDIPESLITDEIVLRRPPVAYHVSDILPATLPQAWGDGVMTTGETIRQSLSMKAGAPLPWTVVSRLIEDARYGNAIDLAPSSGPVVCSPSEAGNVRVQMPQKTGPTTPVSLKPGGTVDGNDLTSDPVIAPLAQGRSIDVTAQLAPMELQDLVDKVGNLMSPSLGADLKFEVRIWTERTDVPPAKVEQIRNILKEISTKFGL